MGIYGAAVLALGVDAIAVFQQNQKSVLNEFVTFAAVCLSAPFAYIVTTGHLIQLLLGLWTLCTLALSSAIFTVKLRKPAKEGTSPLGRAIAYHVISSIVVGVLYFTVLLPIVPTLAFGTVILKFLWILFRLDWYRTVFIGSVASLETITAFLFGAAVMISLVPSHP